MIVLGVGRFEESWDFGGVWGVFFAHVLCTSEQSTLGAYSGNQQ